MNMDENTFHKVRNNLTEYSKNYRSVSPYMMMSYNGLPPYLAKLAHTLFFYIIKTKMYGKSAASKGKNEDRRIYTDIEITLDDLLLDFNPNKYSDGKDIEMDKSNMIKKLKELDKYNIFYCWKYGKKYLFVMEREVGCWKIFNNKGCVAPKTLKKVVNLTNDMITCMVKFEGSNGTVDKKNIERSFGTFMNKMIRKMNPNISSRLPLWSDDKDIYEYTSDVSLQLNKMGEFEGLGFTEKEIETFLTKVPPSVSKKMKKMHEEMRQDEMKTRKEKELEDELLPKNSNLVKGSVMRVKVEKNIKNTATSRPTLMRWQGNIDPFSDSLQFMKYYRSILQNKTGGNIVFNSMESDAGVAAQILDLMVERKRNKDFLDTWIHYFYDNNLKGQKALKPKYTSLRCFKDTFESYNETFHIPN